MKYIMKKYLVSTIFNIKIRMKHFITRSLVKINYIKKSPADLNEIIKHINCQLPLQIAISIPGGIGNITVKTIQSNIINLEKCLNIEVYCDFIISVTQTTIYTTHFKLYIEAIPEYNIQNKSIGLSDVKVTSLKLISDDYSVLKDTSLLLSSLLPKPLKSIFNATLSATMAMLDSTPLVNKSMDEMVKYLSLYSSGSKQLIIDYHRDEIEKNIMKLMQNKSMQYSLNEDIFEEKLFADFGKKIIIENGKVLFGFAHEE